MDKREQFIAEAQKVHGDKYDYSKVEYKRAHDKMCIICPEHGEFWQDKFTHLNGHGCPKCAREKRALNQTYTQEEFIDRCKKVWGNRYTYEHTIYNGITKKVIITCPIHGDFEIIANDFINGHGCSRCSGTKKMTTEEFIEKARKVHGDRYDYSKVNYVNNRTKVCIICPVHGEFWQRPSLHLVGDGCYKCFQNAKKTTTQFIEEARKVHGDKYDYSKVNYIGNKKKITIICPKHGKWETTPIYHLQGHGCQECYNERRGNTIRQSLEEFIQKAKDIHGEKYDYTKVVYKNCGTCIDIICPEHGVFSQTPNKHLCGQGCPSCNESSLEREINLYLEKQGKLFIRQKRFDWLGQQSLDFYIPSLKLGIECQGEQHFKSIKHFGGDDGFQYRIKLDITKNTLCETHGIKLIYVVKDKNELDYNGHIYNGIYKNNIYDVEEIGQLL